MTHESKTNMLYFTKDKQLELVYFASWFTILDRAAFKVLVVTYNTGMTTLYYLCLTGQYTAVKQFLRFHCNGFT